MKGTPFVMKLLKEAEEDLAAGGPFSAFLDPALLDDLDMSAILHVARQPLLLVAGEQVDPADLPQVHPDRIVDAFPLFQLGFFFLVRFLFGFLEGGATPERGVDGGT